MYWGRLTSKTTLADNHHRKHPGSLNSRDTECTLLRGCFRNHFRTLHCCKVIMCKNSKDCTRPSLPSLRLCLSLCSFASQLSSLAQCQRLLRLAWLFQPLRSTASLTALSTCMWKSRSHLHLRPFLITGPWAWVPQYLTQSPAHSKCSINDAL